MTIDGETKLFHDKNKFIQYLSTNPSKDNEWKTLIKGKLHTRKGNKLTSFNKKLNFF